MKKFVTCKNCKENIYIKIKVRDRIELSQKMGNAIDLTCKRCNTTNNYFANEVRAIASRFYDFLFLVMLFASGVVGFILFKYYWNKSIYLYYIIPMAVAIPGLIFFTLTKSQNQKIRTFNGFYI